MIGKRKNVNFLYIYRFFLENLYNFFALQSDKDHHKGVSPLLHLDIGLISHFPPRRYILLICVGVMTWIGKANCLMGG